MNRTRLAVGIAIPVVLAIILGVLFLQGRGPADQTAPAATVTPTTTSAPPPTTQAQPPKATGEDWLATMRGILSYRHSLYANPQPDLLDQIYDHRCPCYAQERKALADLQRRGWRYNDKGVTVLRTKLLGRATGNVSIVAVEVVGRSSPQILVDRTGKILEQKSGSSATKTPYQLVRGKDGRWRVSLIGISLPDR